MPAVDEGAPWLERLRIRPFFQPIVDLSSGLPLGYEILSRGAAPFGSPEVMFRMAKEMGLLWDLERACRTAAIQKISSLPAALRAPASSSTSARRSSPTPASSKASRRARCGSTGSPRTAS